MRSARTGLLSEAPAAPIALWALGSWLAWAWLGGGHAPDRWGLLGVVIVGAFTIGLATIPVARERLSGRRLVLLSGLLAFVGWNFLSMLWADFPADAWIGSDKALLYVVAFFVFALWPWSPRSICVLLALFALGVAIIGVVVVAHVPLGHRPGTLFTDSRLIDPIGYVDANAALWTMAFWPALFIGSSGALGAASRPIFLAVATFLLELAIMIQSRGWLAAFPVAAIVFLLLSRQRLRMFLGFVLVGAGALAIVRPLLDVYERGRAGVPIRGPFDHAARLMLVSCAGVALAGLLWAVVDARLELPKRTVRMLGVAVVVAALAALIATGTWAATRVDHPGRWVSDRWQEFTCPYCPNRERTVSRFRASLSGDRYREWRVAWDEFERHPLIGIGSDNYEAAYLKERTDPQFEPKYPHSIPLRLLSQLGIVGTLLFLVSLALAVSFAFRRRRRLDVTGSGAVAAALTVSAYWLIHGSVDWFWEIPALAAPAFGFLGAAGAVESRPSPSRSAAPKLRTREVAVAVVTGTVAAALLALPGISYALVQSAGSFAREDQRRAYERLDAAADLNPWSAEPPLVAGSIALRRHNWSKASSSLAEAAEREPKNWYVHVQLALLADNRGRFRAAEREIRRARELNPQDAGAALLDRIIARRVRIDPNALSDLYLQAAQRRFR